MESLNHAAIITGGSRGIGLAIAKELAKNGWEVWLISKNLENLKKAKAEILKMHSNAVIEIFSCDLSDVNSIKLFFEKQEQQLNRVEILVNNVGVFKPGKIIDEDISTLDEMLDVNLKSTYWVSKFVVKFMIKKHSGHIFNIQSVASLQAYENGGSYSISKFALRGFTLNLREELKPFGVKVTGINSGAVYTDSWSGSGVSKDRIMDTEDIGKLIWAFYNSNIQTVVEEVTLRPILGDL